MKRSSLPIYDGGPPAPPLGPAQELYLDLLKRTLTRWDFEDADFDPAAREVGLDHPLLAETMVGLRRLENVLACVVSVVTQGVPGDLIETGVWRGGVTIFMRGLLKALDANDRTVWVADSFRGLPKPNVDKYPADEGDVFWTDPDLSVSVETVKSNFRHYGLLDEQVRFLVGWFADTLPGAPIAQLAVIRLDGDMYGSTMEAMTSLYPRLSIGGYIIVDDYGCVPACKQAIDDYRSSYGVDEEIHEVDWTGIYWQRTR